jgi:pyruvate/2-oxoacid:ferredoxin oxidoreductase alpha subunit
MANVNRTLGPPWNIWSEQTDSLAQRDTGWLQFYCENNQEILDTTIQAFKICEKISLPGMISLDAFYHSHTSEPVDIPEQKDVDKFLSGYKPKYKLDVKAPHTFGGLTSPEWYYELRYKIQESMTEALDLIKEVGNEYAKITGRKYELIEKYRTDDAEQLLIAVGAISQTAKDAIDIMRKKNKKIGLARIRTFRPFPKEDLKRIIKKVKVVGIIDRDISFGNEGIFFQEVKSAIYNEKSHPPIYGFIAGLGGRDVTTEDIIRLSEDMSKGTYKKEMVWVGAKI